MSKTDVRKRVTLMAVAKHSGVDASTVSRVLNDDPNQRVSQKTRDRIMSSVKELGYRPNLLARGLRTQQTSSICIVLPQLDNPAFSNMVDGAVAACADEDYFPYIVLTPPESDTATVLKKLEQLDHVDGVLAASYDDSAVVARAVQGLPMPTVLLNKKADGATNCVWMDSENAAEAVVHHLLASGHRRIGFVGGIRGGFNAEQRRTGYLAALKSYDIEPDPAIMSDVGYGYEDGMKAAADLVEQTPDLTALFAATFASAAGCLNAVRNLPETRRDAVAVAGIHGGILADCLGLTAVDMPTYQLGLAGATGLIELIRGETNSIRKSLSPLNLVIRKSTSAITGPEY